MFPVSCSIGGFIAGTGFLSFLSFFRWVRCWVEEESLGQKQNTCFNKEQGLDGMQIERMVEEFGKRVLRTEKMFL
ncbi:hypothetical protein BDV06DRAFT_206373 [Aspergillus oleicola]